MKEVVSKRIKTVIILSVTVVLIVLCVFYGFLPKKYDLSVGSVSIDNIYASRSFVDNYQTEYDATVARNSVDAIFVRSDDLSDENNSKIASFFDDVRDSRNAMVDEFGFAVENTDPIIDSLVNLATTKYNVSLRRTQAITLLSMPSSTFLYMEDEVQAIVEVIMLEMQTPYTMPDAIDNAFLVVSDDFESYPDYREFAEEIIEMLVIPNSVYDSEATIEAADNAYINSMNNPLVIERGTRIIGEGQIVDEHSFRLLVDLELVRSDSFDYFILARVVSYVAVIIGMLAFYIHFSSKKFLANLRLTIAFSIAFILPIFASIYVSNLSVLAVFVLFFTVLFSTYYGVSAGIVFSLANLLLLWPVYNFNAEVLLINSVAIFVCAALSSNSGKKSNSAAVILITGASVAVCSLAYNFLVSTATHDYINSIVWPFLAAIISVVSAIGLMPIFELISDAVSPVRLIELSQPGHPLLKRLFLEAPGTSQHSIMVSNLADTAAEAVGADALLCKVSAYYHDVGKLKNPYYFTENITDENPHDKLPIAESVRIITSHVPEGVKLARKYGIPTPILDIIIEHHGTTAPMYFFHKAKEQAIKDGTPEPILDDFKYPGRIPQSKESAIVMLADTCEAAVKSLNTTNLDEVEAMIRKVVKHKVELDQLVKTDLSFGDIELIILAFRQVYYGLYHERIKYPE